jgi:hypothetical protein
MSQNSVVDEQCCCGSPAIGFYRIFAREENPGYLELACEKCMESAVESGLPQISLDEGLPEWLAQEVMWG